MLFALVLLAQIDIPHTRLASGTSWQPDDTDMRAVHIMSNGWMIMLHGAATLGWDAQAGPRGGHDVISTNWAMGLFQHPLFVGDAVLRTMVSLEPVDKTAHDLSVPNVVPYLSYAVHEAVLGFVHHFPPLGPLQPAIGARGSLGFVPSELSDLYGGSIQAGLFAYLLLQARKM